MTTSKCQECGALPGAKCLTKTGRPTKNHKRRQVPPTPSKVAYQPGYAPPKRADSAPLTEFEEARHFIALHESGWTDPTVNLFDLVKSLIAESDAAVAAARSEESEKVEELERERDELEAERDEQIDATARWRTLYHDLVRKVESDAPSILGPTAQRSAH